MTINDTITERGALDNLQNENGKKTSTGYAKGIVFRSPWSYTSHVWRLGRMITSADQDNFCRCYCLFYPNPANIRHDRVKHSLHDQNFRALHPLGDNWPCSQSWPSADDSKLINFAADERFWNKKKSCSSLFLYYIQQIDSILPCVCSFIDHRGRQNVVRTSVTYSPRVPLFCTRVVFTIAAAPAFDILFIGCVLNTKIVYTTAEKLTFEAFY